jgi:hypothetical protein
VQLEELKILNTLVHWPENVFGRLVSLRTLVMFKCEKLTGRTQDSEQSITPRLERLILDDFDSFVEVPTLPAPLRELWIRRCKKLESVIVRKEQNTTRDGVVIRQEKSVSCSEPMSVSLQVLQIWGCQNTCSRYHYSRMSPN